MLTFENQKRPTVLLVGNFLSATRGTRSVCEDLAFRLKAADWCIITTSFRPGRLARLLDFLQTVWRCRNQYHVAHVDVYSGPAFLWAELVCWALRMVKKPYVLTLRGGNLPAFAQKTGERVPRLLRSSPIVTTPSAYLFEQMRPYHKELELLPNPLDLEKYSFKDRAHPVPKLVWLRAFHHIYNPSLAVRVVAQLAQDFPEVRLVMMGPDKGDGSFEQMKGLTSQLGVNDRLMCTGTVTKDEIPKLLNQGDIFLNTPRVDNTPVSVLEAMACGLCIVSTNVGGIPYLLKDESDALLVPTDDAAAMAQAVRRFLTEDGLADRLSKNARIKVEQFDWPSILPKWEKILMEVAAQARK
ncbi:MAG: glycosyl transferase family 1 [Nitrospira sp. SG-bin1]|nr:MAG: glycosyl transferase family 1 [Nitrospira sp. SG-bin1]